VENYLTKNAWRYWRPVYRYTWALIQKSSYEHFCDYVSRKDFKILDIGTGTGVYIKSLPEKNYYYFSDIDIKSVLKAEKEAKNKFQSKRYEMIHGDALSALDRVEGVDLISLIHVISVVPNPHEVIEKAIEKLNPGGELLIYISRLSKNIPDQLQDKFHRFGFRTLKLDEMNLKWKIVRVSPLNECYIFKKNV